MIELDTVNDEIKQYITRLETQVKQNIVQFKTYEKKIGTLEKETQALKKETHTLEKKTEVLEKKNHLLEEKLKLALFRQFGRSTERYTGEGQHLLFESEETAAPAKEEPANEQTITIPSHTRKKRGRKPLDEKLPRVETIIDIDEKEKHCACGNKLVCIGEEVSERLQIIPQQVWVEKIIKPKYACHHCEGSGDEEKPAVRMAKTPGNIIPGSIASASLLSFIFTNKYADHLPFYRQEIGFQRIGVSISRQNMSNWQRQVCKKLNPLLEKMKEHLKTGRVLQMDETGMQVLNEPGKNNGQKSYMWLARGGPPDRPVIWYEYRESRSAKHITPFLEGFSGYLQSDGYPSYDTALKGHPQITHVSCMAHVRRQFFEASKITGKPGLAEAALSQIKGLYVIEKNLRKALREKEISEEQFVIQRRKACTPVLKAFHEWLEKNAVTVLDTSKLGEAISYALRQWPKLVNYLLDVNLTPDNNACESAIRPFVIGRKNWIISGSPEGAQSSCELFTLIETAKGNKWNPYEYLKTIFERAAQMKPSDDWEQLLPWNLPK